MRKKPIRRKKSNPGEKYRRDVTEFVQRVQHSFRFLVELFGFVQVESWYEPKIGGGGIAFRLPETAISIRFHCEVNQRWITLYSNRKELGLHQVMQLRCPEVKVPWESLQLEATLELCAAVFRTYFTDFLFGDPALFDEVYV